MAPNGDILRMIEEVNMEDEAKLQAGFNDYDRCTGISKPIFNVKTKFF